MAHSPNIIHISMHDAGRHFGCYGIDTVHTPNFDRLAGTGMRFSRAFASAAVCSPSRGACLTGRYPQSNGLIHLCHSDFGYRFNPGEKHLSHLLSERGYKTVLHGFQHEVHHDEVRTALGFDECFNVDPAPPIYPCPPADVIASGACEWLEQTKDQTTPFYMQLGFFESHRPYDFGGCEPDDSLGVTVPDYIEDTPAARRDHAALQGAIRKADAAVGLVLDKLESLELAEDTLVIFTPDHGLANPRAKATLYDPGLEIAMLMRWPARGLSGGRVIDQMVSNVDLLPTVWDLSGWERLQNFQGQSLAPAIAAKDTTEPIRDAVFALHHDGDLRMVRTETHKLIRNFNKRSGLRPPVDIEGGAHPIVQATKGGTHIPAVELYDLRNDPIEANNLANDAEYADERAALEAMLWQWMKDCEDPILRGGYTSPRHAKALKDYETFRARG